MDARVAPRARLPAMPMLQIELTHVVRAMSCVLDGEIVALAADGRSKFSDLMVRRDWPHFVAFGALFIDSDDLRDWPRVERKARLRTIMPRPEANPRLLYHTTSTAAAAPYSMLCARRIGRAASRCGSMGATTPMGRPRRG
jgi:ATP-dependent DNA ligase